MIRVTLDPGTMMLRGLPSIVSRTDWASIEWPPCPSCGVSIEVESLDVGTFGQHPSNRDLAPGRWSCPNDCNPSFPRVVVADNFHQFVDYCRGEGWNPMRIMYVNSTDPSTAYRLRGIVLLPSMISVVGVMSREIQEYVRARIKPGHTWNTL